MYFDMGDYHEWVAERRTGQERTNEGGVTTILG